MVKEIEVFFKAGERAEAKSFEKGFRGAWFRCKIVKEKKDYKYLLEYYDFPDEKKEWTSAYQVPRHIVRRVRDKHRELMLRPEYPLIYSKKQTPHASDISRVAVVVDDAWKVGDLVEWSTEGCYWCGRIIQLLGDGEAEIELFPEPLGEGKIYKAFLKDLRPSLKWSPEHGWTVPTQNGATAKHQLIQPINSDSVVNKLVAMETQISPVRETEDAVQETEGQTGSSVESSFSDPPSSNSLAVSDELKNSGTMDTQKRGLDNSASKEMSNVETIKKPNSEHHGTQKTREADVVSAQNSAAKVVENTVSKEVSVVDTIKKPTSEHHCTKTRRVADIISGQISAAKVAENTVSEEMSDVETMKKPNSEHHSTTRTRVADVISGQISAAKVAENTVSEEMSDVETMKKPNTEHHSTKRTRVADVISVPISTAKVTENTVSKDMSDVETIKKPDSEHHSTKKTRVADVISAQISAAKVAEKELQCSCPPKFRARGGTTLNSTHSDTMEASIRDLEECINKIKWLQKILSNGISPSDAPRSKWEVVDQNSASSWPK